MTILTTITAIIIATIITIATVSITNQIIIGIKAARKAHNEQKVQITRVKYYFITDYIAWYTYRLLTIKFRKEYFAKKEEEKIAKILEATVDTVKRYLNKQCQKSSVIEAYKNLKKATNQYTLKEIFVIAKKNRWQNNMLVTYIRKLTTKNKLTNTEIQKMRFYVRINHNFMYI